MNEVENILKNYVNAIESAKSAQIVVANVRSFAEFLKSSSLQPIITSLKEQKYSDLKEFQTALTAFQADKKKAFVEIADFVKSTPFLENRLSSDLFAQNDPDQFVFYEPFVQLDIRRFNEDLQRLIWICYYFLDTKNIDNEQSLVKKGRVYEKPKAI